METGIFGSHAGQISREVVAFAGLWYTLPERTKGRRERMLTIRREERAVFGRILKLTGPIILQKAVAVEENDTPETLQRRIMEQAEWKIMPEAINLIAHGKVSVKDGKVFIS